MPTYDYQCRSCGTVTELIHSMLEPGPTTCERCGGELRRVIYPAGIIFKGSGFYRNDSRGSDTSSDGAGEGSAAKPAAAEVTTSTAPAGDAAKSGKKKDDAASS